MATYRVYGKRTVYVYADVEASDKAEAENLVENMDQQLEINWDESSGGDEVEINYGNTREIEE